MVENISHFLDKFVQKHIKSRPENENAYRLKIEHTRRVTEETVKIGKAIGLDNCQLSIARICAILHDIGRFEQYARYETFADRKSENHAKLSAKIIERENILTEIPSPYDELIIYAVANHNIIKIEENCDAEKNLYLKLLRDADKIDILNVFLLQDHSKDGISAIIDLGLPDNGKISDKIYNALMNHRTASYRDIRSIADFRLLKIAWVFDLYFKPSYDIFQKRGYLRLLRKMLPQNSRVDEIFIEVQNYAREKFMKGES
ncbi:MAG: HD domain-containing protein [Candidatus Zixiibacteriota bacterium]